MRYINERHYVYRCLDAQGRIVYVGCSRDVEARMKQHRKTGVGPATHRLRVTVHPNLIAALEVERREIVQHEPLLNRQLFLMDIGSWSREKLLERLRHEITRRRGLPFQGDANSAISTLRREYHRRFDSDALAEL